MAARRKKCAKDSSLRKSIKSVLAKCRKSEPALAIINLPIAEMHEELPLTFITFHEWCAMKWRDIPLNPSQPLEWDEDVNALDYRFTDILFGTWLAWYYNYVLSVQSEVVRGKKPRARRLDGTIIKSPVFEERVFHRTSGKYNDLYATFSALKCPAEPEWLACVACTLHNAEGDYYAEAFAWNPMTGTVSLEDAIIMLEDWVANSCTNLKGKFSIPDPYTICPDPDDGGLTVLYVDPLWVAQDKEKKTHKSGKVIPFRRPDTPDLLHN